MECVECRNTGVTKRGVCPKCPQGATFIARTDGGLRMALDAEFAKRFAAEPRGINGETARAVAAMVPEEREEYERARVKLDLVGPSEAKLRLDLEAAEARELEHIREQERLAAAAEESRRDLDALVRASTLRERAAHEDLAQAQRQLERAQQEVEELRRVMSLAPGLPEVKVPPE